MREVSRLCLAQLWCNHADKNMSTDILGHLTLVIKLVITRQEFLFCLADELDILKAKFITLMQKHCNCNSFTALIRTEQHNQIY